MDKEKILRDRLVYVLEGKGAHVQLTKVISDFPIEFRGKKPSGVPYSAWQLLEHMRIAQWDILEFSRNPQHISPKWPEGYWPADAIPPNNLAWDNSIEQFLHDLKEMQDLVKNLSTDLYVDVPYGKGQNILREVLLVADHNAYHLGQLVMLRKMFGIWTG